MERWCKREPVPTCLLGAGALHIVGAQFMFLKGTQQSPGGALSGRNKSKWATEKQKSGVHGRKQNLLHFYFIYFVSQNNANTEQRTVVIRVIQKNRANRICIERGKKRERERFILNK